MTCTFKKSLENRTQFEINNLPNKILVQGKRKCLKESGCSIKNNLLNSIFGHLEFRGCTSKFELHKSGFSFNGQGKLQNLIHKRNLRVMSADPHLFGKALFFCKNAFQTGKFA